MLVQRKFKFYNQISWHFFSAYSSEFYQSISLSLRDKLKEFFFFFFFFFFFHWHYSPLWALACRTMSFHFVLSTTNSLHLLTPSTLRSLSTSPFHLFLCLPLLLVPSSSWAKIFLNILSSCILSRWLNQLILCPFIHFTIFPPLLISSSSRFVRLFHYPFSYLGPYILLNIFLSKISRACSSFFVNVHSSALYDTNGLISVLHNKLKECTLKCTTTTSVSYHLQFVLNNSNFYFCSRE